MPAALLDSQFATLEPLAARRARRRRSTSTSRVDALVDESLTVARTPHRQARPAVNTDLLSLLPADARRRRTRIPAARS